MKIKINSDPFNIAKRIKSINKNYYVVFDTFKQTYEIHNSSFANSYCITIPYKNLDCRAIELIKKSENVTETLLEIEKHNKKLENQNKNNMLDKVSYQLKQIYDYSNSHVKNFDGNAFKNIWI